MNTNICKVAPMNSPDNTSSARFYVDVISVGDGGLTQRPAVIDRSGPPWPSRVVKVFRSTEEVAAIVMAALLNESHGNPEAMT